MVRRNKEENPEWMQKARVELNSLSKEELVEKIVQSRKDNYSAVGKRNVSTAKSHERRCKTLLTEWSGVEFRRRRIEGRGDDVSVVEGVADIIPVNNEVIFAIECKKGEKFSIDSLLSTPKTALFTEWWHQANYDAYLLTSKTNVQRYPFLFFKPTPMTDWVAVPSKCFDDNILVPKNSIPHGSGCWFPHLKFNSYSKIGKIEHNISTSKKNPVMYGLELFDCVICRWKDFADQVDPSTIFLGKS